MCGICGFNWEDKELVRRMCKSLVHRGPDDKGIYTDKNISLGHKRLSIIDLSKAGKQPMSNENGDIWITFNGEIYNFKELRADLEKKYKFNSNTDTEVIIHAYEEHGEGCLDLLEGDFAFCIYDSRKNIFFLARDRLGVKPLYFYHNKGKFMFASEIKAILENEEVKRQINKDALNKFISLRYVPGEQTIFDNIYRLMSGDYLVYYMDKDVLIHKNYWDLKLYNKRKHSEDYYAKHIIRLFHDSVKQRLISDVPLGAYLSGGIDSSAIVAMMHQIRKQDNDKEEIKTFSVGFEQGDYVNELPYARQISDIFSTNHKEIFIKPNVVELLPKIIWNLDEPMADPALIPVYLLSQQAKKDITVVLTGDGGDEVFAGYDQYKFLGWGNKLKHIPFSNNASEFMNLMPPSVLNKIYKYSSKMGKDSFKKVDLMISAFKKDNTAKAYYELVSLINDKERKELLKQDWFRKLNYPALNKEYFMSKQPYLNQLLHFDTKNLLPESYLMKTDRMTMAHAVEGRVPFLDHKLVQFAYNTPSSLKLRNGTTKYILKKSLSRYLPRHILHRKKQTFHVPIESWIKNDLGEYFDSMLDEKQVSKMNIFNYSQIHKIFKNYKSGELYYARQAWNLMCFKIWHDKFIL